MRLADLPTYDEARTAELSGSPDAIEQFIADYTPVVAKDEQEFRADLLSVINYVEDQSRGG